jgi:hypothetical protein
MGMAKENKKGVKKVLTTLNRIVDDLKDELDMRDWTFDVYYCPNCKSDSIADVTYSVHKEADITVHEYRQQYVKYDLMHEMLHCKVGMISKAYDVLIDKQREMIDELAERYEEVVVDDFVRLAKQYVKK